MGVADGHFRTLLANADILFDFYNINSSFIAAFAGIGIGIANIKEGNRWLLAM